jgi:hypothetical protein
LGYIARPFLKKENEKGRRLCCRKAPHYSSAWSCALSQYILGRYSNQNSSAKEKNQSGRITYLKKTPLKWVWFSVLRVRLASLLPLPIQF